MDGHGKISCAVCLPDRLLVEGGHVFDGDVLTSASDPFLLEDEAMQ